MGKALAALMMVMGYSLIIVPTGIVSAELAQAAAKPPSAHTCRHCMGEGHDLDALRALAQRDLRYLGLIGSRAKVARLFEALGEESVPESSLRNVHAPVGLDIGAITPQEIAVSILAELVAVKYGKLAAPTTGDGPDAGVASLRWMPGEARRAAVSVDE